MFFVGQLVRITKDFYKASDELGIIQALKEDCGGRYAEVKLLKDGIHIYPDLVFIEDICPKDLKDFM
jgi:hypothetical protein